MVRTNTGQGLLAGPGCLPNACSAVPDVAGVKYVRQVDRPAADRRLASGHQAKAEHGSQAVADQVDRTVSGRYLGAEPAGVPVLGGVEGARQLGAETGKREGV